MLPRFSEYVDKGEIFVEPPTQLIFLCGGKISAKTLSLTSLRDAFLKIPVNPALVGREVLLAEKVNTFHLSRPAYSNLLGFEVDFAQVCNLILLFSESQGSIAELGAFSMVPDLASKLLVVVRDYHLKDDSFIKLGPLQHLKLTYGDQAVFVLNDDDSGIHVNSLRNLDLTVLRDRLTPAINDRLAAVRERATFDRSRNGHLIKMMVGMIQEFGGLTAAELKILLAEFGVDIEESQIDQLLLCAEAARWISREQRGFALYYFANGVGKDALVLKFLRGAPIFNKGRRRQAFRDHWQATDRQRHGGILKLAGVVS